MKKIVLIVLIFAMCVVFCACENRITSGEVYEKEYRGAFTTVSFMPLVIYNGNTTTTTYVPYVITYPERYVIFIREYRDGEWLTEDFYVSKEVYEQVQIGDMFEFNETRGDLEDEPYTKEKQEATE